MKNIKKIYDNDYSIAQYYSDNWHCEIDNKIPMTLVVEVINMHDATGEDEYKDYPVVFSIGMLNKNIHPSLKDTMDIGEDEGDITPNDVIGYYGMNCYLEQKMIDTDKINANLMGQLSIQDACIYSYECRFSKKNKEFLKFKTEEKAFEFAEKLIMEYGDTFMSLIGFYLDAPINLMGENAWKQTKTLNSGE